MYNDDYPTCSRTFATLRIYGLQPDEVTRRLQLAPTSVQVKGQQSDGRRIGLDGWFLSTEPHVASRDLRRHLDWVFTKIVPAESALREMKVQTTTVDVFCYWLSAQGHGGPTLSPSQSRMLAQLELELVLDLYVDRSPGD